MPSIGGLSQQPATKFYLPPYLGGDIAQWVQQENNAIQDALNSLGAGQTRVTLAAPTTFYVSNTAGSDTNSGLTPTAAWATLAHATAKLASSYDFGGQTVTLQVLSSSTTFTERLTITPWSGGGTLIFDGGGKTINYAGVATNDGAVFVQGGALPGLVTIQNVTITTTKGASRLVTGVFMQSASSILIGANVTFGANFSANLLALNPGSIIYLNNNLTFNGSTTGNPFFVNGGVIRLFGPAISITISTPITVGIMADAINGGLISLPNNLVTFVNGNNVTGQRYTAAGNAIITTAGGGPNFIPGTTAGTVVTGGQYL